MIGRFRHALYSAIGTLDAGDDAAAVAGGMANGGGGAAGGGVGGVGPAPSSGSTAGLRVKYPYQRPLFLQVRGVQP